MTKHLLASAFLATVTACAGSSSTRSATAVHDIAASALPSGSGIFVKNDELNLYL